MLVFAEHSTTKNLHRAQILFLETEIVPDNLSAYTPSVEITGDSKLETELMPFLRHWINGTTVGVAELVDDFTIGRSPSNKLKIDDGTVSGEHALIKKRGELFVIIDLNSTNGILFNGKPVQEHTFAEGDVVTIGTHEFEFVHQLPEEFSRTLKIKKSWIPGVYYTE